jgi:MFS family permease
MSSTVTGRSQRGVERSRDPEGEAKGQEQGRGLRGDEKARLGLLALPTFALALSITIVSTYLSTVTRRYTEQTIVIGAIVGGEGVMALWVPLIAGAWSDRMRSRLGGRLPFVIAGVIPAAVALAVIGFVGSLGLVALVAGVFFCFYFVAYEPYRAMYPDLLDEDQVAGRAQSTQAVARGCGTGLALLGGGLLLSIARPLPFVVSAVILVTATGVFVLLALRRGLGPKTEREEDTPEGPISLAARLPGLVKEHPALRSYMIANSLWETALSALKAFVILYLTVGLHYKLTTASLIIGGVALVILVGAGVVGKAGDRFGRMRVARVALIAYGLGFIVPALTTSREFIAAAIPFIAFGGGAVMTLAYAILMPLMPEDEHGLLTGFYSVSRGVGIIAGPILAGVAISLTSNGPFTATHGFQAVWIVCAVAALTSLLFLRRLKRADEDRRELAEE